MTIPERRSTSDPSLTIDEFVSDEMYRRLIDGVEFLTPEKGTIPPNHKIISSYIQISDLSSDTATMVLYVFFSFGCDAKFANTPVARWLIPDMGYLLRDMRRNFLVPLDKQDELLSIVRDIKMMGIL